MAAPTNYKAFYKLKVNANDETGLYNATSEGTPEFKNVGSLLDGATDYFSLPQLGLSTNFSFSFWFNSNDVTLEQENAYAHKNDDVYVSNKIKASKLALFAYDGTVTEVSGVTTLVNNKWYMATYVYRDGGLCELYLDSVFENNITAGTFEDDGPQGSPYIGTNSRADGNFFNGLLANYRVYNYDLGAAQVLAIYEEEKAQFYPESSGNIVLSGSAKGLDEPRASGLISINGSANPFPSAFATGTISISGSANVTHNMPKINLSGYLQSVIAEGSIDFGMQPVTLDGTLASEVIADAVGAIDIEPIHFRGYLYSDVSASENILDGIDPISIGGTLSATVVGNTEVVDFNIMHGTLSSSVKASISINTEPVSMNGTLESTVVPNMLMNAYVAMYGFLSAAISKRTGAFCFDLNVEMITEEIISLGCNIEGASMPLTRFRGDTYPVLTKLGLNGDPDVTGYTFRMSTQIDNGVVYTVDGVISDASNGIVTFELDLTGIDLPGVGVYDIEGNDGSYVYTFDKGVFTLLDDVTV